VIPRLADRQGRKWIIVASTVAAAGAYAGIMFSTDISLTYFFLLINGLSLAGRISVAYVYLMELLPKENRTFVGTTLLASESLVGLIGVFIFKYFHKASYTYFAYPGLVMTVAGAIMMALLPESPVYLLRSDQKIQAGVVLRRIAA